MSERMLCMGGLLGGRWLLARPVYVVIRNGDALLAGEVDQAPCDVRGYGLAPLVLGYVSLRDTEPVGEDGLGYFELLADAGDLVHFRILVRLINKINSGTDCVL